MHRRVSLGLLAAAISIAAAGLPAVVQADPSSCQPGAAPASGDPSTAGGVTIYLTKTNQVFWCSAEAISASSDTPSPTNYQVRATQASGAGISVPVSNAISVGGLLTLAGVDVATVDHVELARQTGGAASLSGPDLTDPSARFESGLKPIFWINGSETQYLRPLRSPSDLNGADQIAISNGQPLDVYLYTGPLLSVTATATPNPVAVKRPVTLTAHVSNRTAADGSLTYTWAFGDNQKATGITVKHSYAVAGPWTPSVTVQGANDSGGVSAPLVVTVGALSKGGTAGKPGGSNRKRTAHHGGPKLSRGTTPNTTPTQKRSSGTSTQPTSTSTQTTTQQSTTPATTTPAPTTPAAPPQTTHASPVKSHSAPGKHERKRRRSPAHRTIAPQPNPAAALVKGRLIADVIPVSAVQLAQQNHTSGRQPSPAHAPSAALSGGSPTPVSGIAAGCAIMLLLGSGAGLELRSGRREVTPTRSA